MQIDRPQKLPLLPFDLPELDGGGGVGRPLVQNQSLQYALRPFGRGGGLRLEGLQGEIAFRGGSGASLIRGLALISRKIHGLHDVAVFDPRSEASILKARLRDKPGDLPELPSLLAAEDVVSGDIRILWRAPGEEKGLSGLRILNCEI